MNSNSFKITICALASIFLLSSCLGDQNESIESGKDLAYITSFNNTKCAATNCGYITSPEIQALALDECYLVGYSISTPAVNGIYTTDRFINVSVTPLPQSPLREGTPQNDQENNFAVDNLTIPFFYPTRYMGDRWIFKYSATLNKNEKLIPRYYYDVNNQVDKNGDNIKNKNMVVIDVYFEKVIVADQPSSGMNEYLTIASLQSLRSLYNPDYSQGTITSTGRYVDVQILFRYHMNKGAGVPSEISYVGNWETFSRVYMTFGQNS